MAIDQDEIADPVSAEIDAKLADIEQAKAELAAEPEQTESLFEAPAVDDKGKQLRFEGLKVDSIVTQLSASGKIKNIKKLDLRKTYRLEVFAKLEETRFKDATQLDRIQVLRVLNAELIEEVWMPGDE